MESIEDSFSLHRCSYKRPVQLPVRLVGTTRSPTVGGKVSPPLADDGIMTRMISDDFLGGFCDLVRLLPPSLSLSEW